MQEGMTNRIMTYAEAFRGPVSIDDYITASVLINEIKKNNKDSDDFNADQAYAALLETADSIGVRNPFRDKDHFFYAFQQGKDLKRSDWESMIAQTASANRMPVLPGALVELYKKRLVKKPETVLIAEAERFVPNLQSIVDASPDSKFVLTTQKQVYQQAFENIFDGYDNVEILQTNIYQYEFIERRFDLIFSCPNFGGRTLAEDTTFMCREYDMVALENLSLHLKDSGELVIILPGRITFASGKVKDLREFIQMTYTIKELAELPEGTIECCGIKVYLLDIENTRPGDDDIVVRRYTSGEKRNRRASITSLEVSDDTFVMLSELEELGSWSIDRIFAQQDEDYLNYQNSSIRKDMIGNVAQVFRGKSVTKKDQSGSIGVVNISNIGEYEIDYEHLEHLEEEERKISNYILQEGDVLLPARGTAIRTSVFRCQNYPCIASSNVIVIRPDPRKLDSTYLKIFLDSPIGNKLISGAQQGMIVMNISYKDLNILEIPIPVLESQKQTAKEYTEELKKYKDTIAAAEKRWSEVLSRLQNF